MNKYIIGLLPFILTCIPGIRLNADFSIMAYDVYFSVLFFLILLKNKKYIMPIKLKEVRNIWNSFFAFLMMSLLMTSIIDGKFYIGPLLKGLRLFYPSIACTYIYMHEKMFDYNRFLKVFVYSMILCPSIGIFGYVLQIDWLVASGQTTIVGGIILNRASSFWQDATMFGLVTSIFAVLSFQLLLFKNNVNRKLLKIAIILNVIGLCISFSRSGYLVLLIGIIYLTFRGNNKKMWIYSIFSVSLLAIILTYLRGTGVLEELDVVLSRFDSILYFDSSDANAISSGRVEQWQDTIAQFFNSGLYRLFFGYGYKTDTNILSLSDNGYIYSLITTGFIGFSLFFYFIMFYIRNNVIHSSSKQSTIVFFSWLTGMFFLDALTYIPIVVMVFLFPIIDSLNLRKTHIKKIAVV